MKRSFACLKLTGVLGPLFVKTTAFANVRKFFKFFMFYVSEEVFISVQR